MLDLSWISNLWNGKDRGARAVLWYNQKIEDLNLSDPNNTARDSEFWQDKNARRAAEVRHAAEERVNLYKQEQHSRWERLSETGQAGSTVPGAKPRDSVAQKTEGQFSAHELGPTQLGG